MQTYFQTAFRPLNAAERQLQIETIRWLLKKRVSLAQIALLTYRTVDTEREAIAIRYDTRIGVFLRMLPYKGTPLETQIRLARESSKSSLFLLPKLAWKGRKATYCPAYTKDELADLIAWRKSRKILWTKPEKHNKMSSTKRKVEPLPEHPMRKRFEFRWNVAQ